jgi:hypothetical protein
MRNKYEEVAEPILQWVSEHESEGMAVKSDALAKELGLDPRETSIEIERLVHSGYLTGKITHVGPHLILALPALSEHGARAVGVWPSDDPYDGLVAVIEAKLIEESDPETKTKLRGLLGALGDVGKGTATALLTAYIKAHAGLP